jgi:3-oxoacyl-[acyl-carrier-protein] synthase II
MATNVEAMNNTIHENIHPSYKARGEFLKMNFMIPASISMTYGLQGTNSITSFACSAGVIALGEAYRLVKHGYMDKMICGGADYSVSEVG